MSKKTGSDAVGLYIDRHLTKLQTSTAHDWIETDPDALTKIPAALLYMEVIGKLA